LIDQNKERSAKVIKESFDRSKQRALRRVGFGQTVFQDFLKKILKNIEREIKIEIKQNNNIKGTYNKQRSKQSKANQNGFIHDKHKRCV